MRSLEDVILERGLLAPAGLDKARERARARFIPLSAALVEEGFLSERDVLAAQAEQHGLGVLGAGELVPDPRAAAALPAKLATHYGVVPLALDGQVLTLAVSNPVDMAVVEDIQSNLHWRVKRVLAARAEIQTALQRLYGVGADTVERLLSDSRATPDEATAVVESQDLARMAEDASVIRLVNQLLHEAIGDRATDLHFEIERDRVVIRRRVDGILYDTPVPRDIRLLYPAIVSRVKLMSGLDIVERRLPQDGRARVSIARRDYDLRVSVVPSMHGEDIVIRILPSTMLFDLPQLGYAEQHQQRLTDLIAQPHGILFVTGPTGSGKSTTLYACLNRLNTRAVKIITIEDPVEYELKGITQTQVNTKIGLTFARALRSMLRHDPDIMMVGEVRDRETAEIAIQTAMTGHLVLSTLHTNDAAGGAVRLVDMGIDPYLVTSSVLAFVAQRLVRTICQSCRESYTHDGHVLYRGRGCATCHQTGFRGRVAICEFLPLMPAIQTLIMQRASATDIRAAADREGLATLAQDGWDKILQGVTTAEEVLRVTRL